MGRLRPERSKLLLVLALGIVSVALTIFGPRVLGHATNVLFEGVINKRLPAGGTQHPVIAGLRAQGHIQVAEMLSGMHLTPGAGVNTSQIARILGELGALYVFSALFGWLQAYTMAGIAQRTMYHLRE